MSTDAPAKFPYKSFLYEFIFNAVYMGIIVVGVVWLNHVWLVNLNIELPYGYWYKPPPKLVLVLTVAKYLPFMLFSTLMMMVRIIIQDAINHNRTNNQEAS